MQEQVLELPIKERWTIVQIVLASIQQETLESESRLQKFEKELTFQYPNGKKII